MIKFFQSFALSTLFLVLTGCISEPANNAPLREDREPEAATGLNKTIAKRASHYMVASANPYASEAGYQMLEKGGNAVDAAIAVQLALTLVEPQSSGIGGGAFMLYYDNKQQKITSFNGRETAPANATQDLFLDDNGKPVRWIDAVVGGRSVGVPGVLKALENAHKKHGELPWATLFEYPISLAEDGFIVSDRMAKLVSMAFNPGVLKLENAHNYFYPDGEPIKSGTLLKNPELAKVYKAIASQGTDVFYQGWIAEDIVGAVQNSAIAPGKLSLTDLANYDVEEVEPVCGSYRVYQVCGVPPPSSGGVAVIQILKQLEQHNIGQYAPNSEQSIHLFTQSSRLAFADRARYIGDPKYIDVPVRSMLNDKYLEQRGKRISLAADMGKAKAGNLALFAKRADDNAIEMPSTSHISIVDDQGNAISMTTSVEMAFGSAVFVDGFLLNNQLTDFSLAPIVNGKLVANSLQPGKRPRSSMAPMMVLNDDNSLRLIVGSPGGSRIINYVAQTMIGVLDWELSIQDAINLPRVTNRNDATTLEKGTEIAVLQPLLESKGHKVMVRDLNSGIQGIEVFKDHLVGGADPRREGKVLGN